MAEIHLHTYISSADLLFVRMSTEVKNARQLGQLLGCSYGTAHGFWHAYEEARPTEILQPTFRIHA